MSESEKQFSFPRVASSTSGRAKNQIPIIRSSLSSSGAEFDEGEVFKGKAHGMRLRVTQPLLLGHRFYHLAQVGNPAFRAVCQRVPPLESNRCPPALARALDISHALAGLFALEGSDRFRAHGQKVPCVPSP